MQISSGDKIRPPVCSRFFLPAIRVSVWTDACWRGPTIRAAAKDGSASCAHAGWLSAPRVIAPLRFTDSYSDANVCSPGFPASWRIPYSEMTFYTPRGGALLSGKRRKLSLAAGERAGVPRVTLKPNKSSCVSTEGRRRLVMYGRFYWLSVDILDPAGIWVFIIKINVQKLLVDGSNGETIHM